MLIVGFVCRKVHDRRKSMKEGSAKQHSKSVLIRMLVKRKRHDSKGGEGRGKISCT